MALLDFFKKKSSGSLAKDRLKLVLISDRANCNPEIMESIKNDIIKVISKYMDFDESALDVQMAEQDNMTMLEVNIPVANVKRNSGM